jgi:hypothetical protein
MKKVILIELNSKQQKQYEDWCQHLKAIFGEIGILTWTVSSNGIGDTITVTTNNAPNNPLNLTDVDSW